QQTVIISSSDNDIFVETKKNRSPSPGYDPALPQRKTPPTRKNSSETSQT
ncbi:hypothetical protein GWI33_000378, partial [Rhynchophorus ferrugineus]